jgi:hypothetical protein
MNSLSSFNMPRRPQQACRMIEDNFQEMKIRNSPNVANTPISSFNDHFNYILFTRIYNSSSLSISQN